MGIRSSFKTIAKRLGPGMALLVLFPASQYGWASDRLMESGFGPPYVLWLAASSAGLVALWSREDVPQRQRLGLLAAGMAAGYGGSVLFWFLSSRGPANMIGPERVLVGPLGAMEALIAAVAAAGVLALTWGPAAGARRTAHQGAPA